MMNPSHSAIQVGKEKNPAPGAAACAPGAAPLPTPPGVVIPSAPSQGHFALGPDGRLYRQTLLSEEELREAEYAAEILKPFRAAYPRVLKAAADEFAAVHGNEVKAISAQGFVQLMIEKIGPSVSHRRPQRWRWAINQICAKHGVASGNYFDRSGQKLKDMPLGDITKSLLLDYIDTHRPTRSRQVIGLLRTVFGYAVEREYLKVNPAQGLKVRQLRADREKKARSEIPTDSPAQVQIALDVAATFRGGIFVPHVVLLYFAALRPESELLRIQPGQILLDQGLIRLHSMKTDSRRVIHLTANAVAMLRHHWDGQPLSFVGWQEFLSLMRSAQGYDVKPPPWFKPPPGPKRPFVSDLPRHTAASHFVWWAKAKENLARAGHNHKNLKAFYEGLVTPEQAAQMLSLCTPTMPVSEELRAKIAAELVEFGLSRDGAIPEPPQVPTFDVQKPVKQWWWPEISDEPLRDLIWKQGVKATAKELRTDQRWLAAVCRAKGIPIPKAGRYRPAPPQLLPSGSLVGHRSHKEIEALIARHHGLVGAAAALGIDFHELRAYCLEHEIAEPDRREVAAWAGKRPRVKESPQQVETLLGQKPFAQVARILGITEDHLGGYCHRRGIRIPQQPVQKEEVNDLPNIQAAISEALASCVDQALSDGDLLSLALAHAPEGLTDQEILRVLAANGFSLDLDRINAAMKNSEEGRFVRYRGRVHRLPKEVKIEIEALHEALKEDLKAQKTWTVLEAIRCLLGKAPGGLCVNQLSPALPWFGIRLEQEDLLRALERYDAQSRLRLYRGRVTLSQTELDWTRNLSEKEPTPNLAAVKASIREKYAALAHHHLTNVEIMEFIFSQTPHGLWKEEFLELTKELGLDFKEQCIHSVVAHEAKGRFGRKSGRIYLVGAPAPARLKTKDLEQALAGLGQVDRNVSRLYLEVLARFPEGLTMRDLECALRLLGHSARYDTFRRRVYFRVKEGQLRTDRGHVRLVSPQADTSRPGESGLPQT